LKNKDRLFHEKFQAALNDVTAELSAYFWECVPVSKSTISRPFEFVAIHSQGLQNVKKQDHSSFQDYINKKERSFTSHGGNTLIIPLPQEDKDYRDISQFISSDSEEEKKILWQEVANKLSESLNDNDDPKWLSTHGLGVPYLHVRIDSKPKYYSWEEYKEFKTNNDETNSTNGKDNKLPITGTNKPVLTTNRPENESSPNTSPIKKNPSPSNDSSDSQPSNPNHNNENLKESKNENNNSSAQQSKQPRKINSDDSQSTGRILIIISLFIGVIAIFALIMYWMKRNQ